jgi:hypothetical protein
MAFLTSLKFAPASSDLHWSTRFVSLSGAQLHFRRTGRINVKSIQNGLKSVWLAGLVLMWLLFANAAAADDDTAVSISVVDDGLGDLPASDLSGWFFSPDPDLPFPPEPDPSQPWTSPENIETINYWLSLVMDLGSDPSLLSQLYGLGMISSPDLTSVQISQLILSNDQLISQETTGSTPEPVTMGLLGGGLALLGLCAAARARRIRRDYFNFSSM